MASGTLDSTNAGQYDLFMQACLATGAYCMIDVHNFARFNGGVVGQGGPPDEMFVAMWVALAEKYADDSRVIFEITNEPHDLDLDLWVQTCQKVVTGIRNAGALTQMILLPGVNFDSASTIVTTGGADALLKITNPDGSIDGLHLDIHKYLDNRNSGLTGECSTNNIGNFSMVADYLRQKNRKGLISETGASSSPACMIDFCAQNEYINAQGDVFLGYVAWAAGQFDTTYILSLTPTLQPDGSYTDNQLFSQCVLAPYQNTGRPTPSSQSSSMSTSSTATSSISTSSIATSSITTSSLTTVTKTRPTHSATYVTDNNGNKSGMKGGSNASSLIPVATPTPTNAASSQSIFLVKNIVVAVIAGAALF